jgi:hypothetical protein
MFFDLVDFFFSTDARPKLVWWCLWRSLSMKKILEEETPHVTMFWKPNFGMYKTMLRT